MLLITWFRKLKQILIKLLSQSAYTAIDEGKSVGRTFKKQLFKPTNTYVLFHLKDHREIPFNFKADFLAFEANLKQIEKCYRFFETNRNEFIKKDEKIREFESKFEVNLKWIWKEFEENSCLNKLRA